jgi:hypothetical protein
MLDQEAGLTDELSGLLGQDPQRAVATLVTLTDVFFFLVRVVVVVDDQAFLQDLVLARLDIIGVLVVFFVLLFFIFSNLGLNGDVLVFGFISLDVVIVDQRLVVVVDGLLVLFEVLKFVLVKVLWHVRVVVENVVI